MAFSVELEALIRMQVPLIFTFDGHWTGASSAAQSPFSRRQPESYNGSTVTSAACALGRPARIIAHYVSSVQVLALPVLQLSSEKKKEYCRCYNWDPGSYAHKPDQPSVVSGFRGMSRHRTNR